MISRIVHSLSLGAVLFIVWLLLSGHYTPFILTLGIASCVLVVTVTLRMEVADQEGHPLHLTWRALIYWPWLLVEIVKANIDVARRVLSPSLPVTPTMIRIKASQKSDLGQVIYANSITLTPGTISVDVANGEILVHALSREGAEDLVGGEMDRRVTRMVGKDG
ncbi:MAG: Na+/H+ antiporter subunit E [Rhodospirillaceae bacterium]|jgi:multicomponent Na+:H+ antiporter subunit E|nr:Na+/H+ antiporter subunit E [Rhodospirillaceae bacterium]MBT5459841.1 Na+/H+ antiporter subunit E [Rhodospirillaceae bacterium]